MLNKSLLTIALYSLIASCATQIEEIDNSLAEGTCERKDLDETISVESFLKEKLSEEGQELLKQISLQKNMNEFIETSTFGMYPVQDEDFYWEQRYYKTESESLNPETASSYLTVSNSDDLNPAISLHTVNDHGTALQDWNLVSYDENNQIDYLSVKIVDGPDISPDTIPGQKGSYRMMDTDADGDIDIFFDLHKDNEGLEDLDPCTGESLVDTNNDGQFDLKQRGNAIRG